MQRSSATTNTAKVRRPVGWLCSWVAVAPGGAVAWVAGHLVQFAGILLGLAELFVLARARRPEAPHLAALAGAGAVATAATWALAQAMDGVALKQAVDAWVDAPPADEATRFGNAETVLWTVPEPRTGRAARLHKGAGRGR